MEVMGHIHFSQERRLRKGPIVLEPAPLVDLDVVVGPVELIDREQLAREAVADGMVDVIEVDRDVIEGPPSRHAQDAQGSGRGRVKIEVEGHEADRRDARVLEESRHGHLDVAKNERRSLAEIRPQQALVHWKVTRLPLVGVVAMVTDERRKARRAVVEAVDLDRDAEFSLDCLGLPFEGKQSVTSRDSEFDHGDLTDAFSQRPPGRVKHTYEVCGAVRNVPQCAS